VLTSSPVEILQAQFDQVWGRFFEYAAYGHAEMPVFWQHNVERFPPMDGSVQQVEHCDPCLFIKHVVDFHLVTGYLDIKKHILASLDIPFDETSRRRSLTSPDQNIYASPEDRSMRNQAIPVLADKEKVVDSACFIG